LLLQSFLVAADEKESQGLLHRLVHEFADPLITNVLRNKLRRTCLDHAACDAEDLRGNIYVQLLTRLGNLKTNSPHGAIRDFCGYVAVMTSNACNEYLRSKYPQRQSLKNRLRYVLTHDRNFAVWSDDENNLQCSLAGWPSQAVDDAGIARLRELRENPAAVVQNLRGGAEVPPAELSELLSMILNWLKVSIKLEQLVTVVADLLDVTERTIETFEFDSCKTDACCRVTFASTIEQREYLRYVWKEITHLPARQRAALLLSLRAAEGRDVITLFPLTETASLRQIAEAVDIPAQQFANLWRELPLDDAAIANRLGVTRQQVINLRKAARKRLARKEKFFSGR
jgi:hypothetical protein